MNSGRVLRDAAALALAATLSFVVVARSDAVRLPPLTGDWTLERENGNDAQRLLRLEHNLDEGDNHVHWSSSFDVKRDDLPGLTREAWEGGDADVSFDLPRDAGRFHFEGRVGHGQGRGSFRFVPDEAFRGELERDGYEADDADLARLAIHDVSRAWIREFAKTGHHFESLDGMVRFAAHRVDPRFVDRMQELGYKELSDDDIVRLTAHQVDVSYVEAIGALTNPKPNADDLVRLKAHGVDPAYVRGFRELAPPMSVDDIVRLSAHGVTPEYARAIRDAGYRGLAADNLVRLKSHDITPEFARRAREEHGPLEVDELIRLKANGRI